MQTQQRSYGIIADIIVFNQYGEGRTVASVADLRLAIPAALVAASTEVGVDLNGDPRQNRPSEIIHNDTTIVVVVDNRVVSAIIPRMIVR